MQHDDERFGMTETPDFIKDAAKGIEVAKKASAENAEADHLKAKADQCKDELQRATDEKVRLAKDAAEELSEYHGLELEVRIKAKASRQACGGFAPGRGARAFPAPGLPAEILKPVRFQVLEVEWSD
jgi:hypothetical protein